MKDMEGHDACERLHRMLAALPWFDGQKLQEPPNNSCYRNGLYFFYEAGEDCESHGVHRPRIVRVGTNRKQGNLAKRLLNHYRTGGGTRFRRQICRAIARRLNRWEPWMSDPSNQVGGDRRFPTDIQEAATVHFKNHLRFRWIQAEEKERREDLEKRAIGTLASCSECSPSEAWLGHHAYERAIRKSGLWAVQHTGGKLRLREQDLEFIKLAVEKSLE